MVFSVGETVVYPHHGAALIEAIETRIIKGEPKQYLVLRVAQGDLTVRVPADNVDLVGVRAHAIAPASSRLSLSSPSRMRPFTVPTGSCSISAIWLCVKPPK